MIAGQDAEAAGVDRNRLMQPELGREVGHRPRPEHARVPRAPRVLRAEVLLKPAVGVVDAPVQRELRGARLELRRGNPPQHRDRVVVALLPQHRVDVTEERARLLVPAPPEVLRQHRQPLMHRRGELTRRPRLAHDGRHLGASRHQHAHVVVVEAARRGGLDDEHALQHPAVHDRHAQERLIRVLAGLAEVLEPRDAWWRRGRPAGASPRPPAPQDPRLCASARGPRPPRAGRRWPRARAWCGPLRGGRRSTRRWRTAGGSGW